MRPSKTLAVFCIWINIAFGQQTGTAGAQGSSIRDRAFLTFQEGDLAAQTGDPEMAESKFRTVFNLPDAGGRLSDVRATAGFALGTILLQQGRRKESIDVFNSVANMANAPQNLKDLASQAAEKARQSSEIPKSPAVKSAQIRKQVALLLNQGALYMGKGDMDMAEATFRSAFQFDRKDVGDVRAVAGYGLAVILSKSDREKEAIEVLDKVLAIPDARDDTKASAKRLKDKLTK